MLTQHTSILITVVLNGTARYCIVDQASFIENNMENTFCPDIMMH